MVAAEDSAAEVAMALIRKRFGKTCHIEPCTISRQAGRVERGVFCPENSRASELRRPFPTPPIASDRMFFAPAPHAPRVSPDLIDPLYRRLRWQVFAGILVGYAGYYLVRKNFSLAVPFLVEQGFSKGELGFAMSGVAIAYGFSKFLMGVVSDRSNPRLFLPLGLLLSAGLTLVMGLVPGALSSIAMMFALQLLNGWVQGMGWPPSGRTMVHWWSQQERGMVVSAWNIAHNIGGGLIGPLFLLGMHWFGDWHSAFYVPAVVAIVAAVFSLATMRDTPQSCGLPPVEEWRNDYPPDYDTSHERELSTKEIFLRYILPNRMLWVIAFANVFVYLLRYGVLDWAPTYLKEVKQFTLDKSSWAYFLYEFAGIPGTLLCGWVSDRVFRGNRGTTGVVFMILVTCAVIVYWLNPAGQPLVDMAALFAIGFLIYGPVMLIGLHALELAPKKAAGTAAGFTGLFGYLGGSVAANAAIGFTVDRYGWDGGFMLLIASSLAAVVLLAISILGGRSKPLST
jgi:OPA family glycerol-3-phosphate transporter-like MFS transporter